MPMLKAKALAVVCIRHIRIIIRRYSLMSSVEIRFCHIKGRSRKMGKEVGMRLTPKKRLLF